MSTSQRLIILINLISIFIASQVFGKINEEKIINDIIKKLKKIDSYQVEFLMKTQMMNKEVETTGRIFFKKPSKYKIEIEVFPPTGEGKMKQLTICDGKIIWSYIPAMKTATKLVLDKLDKKYRDEILKQYQMGVNTDAYFKKDEIKRVKVDKLNNEKVYIVEVEHKPSPTTAPAPFTPAFMKIWVAVKDGFMRKIVMYTGEGKEMLSMQFKNIKLNPKLKDEIFYFTPPADCQITDVTEATKNMMRQKMQRVR